MKKTRVAQALAAGFSTLVLSACGGGGADDGSAAPRGHDSLAMQQPAQPDEVRLALPERPASQQDGTDHALIPMRPLMPVAPAQPENPEKPVTPTTPVAPIQPVQPVEPPKPVKPTLPGQGDRPVKPVPPKPDQGTPSTGTPVAPPAKPPVTSPTTPVVTPPTTPPTPPVVSPPVTPPTTPIVTPPVAPPTATPPAVSIDPGHGATGQSILISSPRCAMQYRWPATKRAEKAGADAKMAEMWHLENTGSYYRHPGMKAGEDLGVKPVWNQGWRGEGIRIAILDDGLEMTHEDLYPNIGTGSHNFRKYRTALDEGFGRPGSPVGHQDYPVPCDATDSHGTAVAGIAAARDHNQVGGAGVAPRATLVGLNVLSSNLLDDTTEAFTYGLDKNHIYNSSWGPDDDGQLSEALNNRTRFNATLEHGLKTGRNGRGAIYVFSGGNGAENGDYSSADGMVSSLGVITACASNAAGLRAPYSERGANLTVCAPTGGAVEDDEDQRYLLNTVTPGLNNTYREFAGTSAAAPMVSGVVALMLQRNSSLTWRDVPLILARTARRIDTAHGGWKEHRSPLGAGNGAYDTIHYSHSYGFGVANAEAAVALAGQWQSVGGSDSLKQCGPYRVTVDQDIPEANIITSQAASGTPRAIIEGNTQDLFFKALLKEAGRLDYNRPPQGAMLSSVEVPQDCNIQHIEHVDVGITVTGSDGKGEHPNAGDLQIALQSPGNRVSTLLIPHPCTTTTRHGGDEVQAITACTGLQNFHFGVRRHLEEPVVSSHSQTWKLGVVDRVKGGTGKLKDWEITFYGR